MWVSASRHLTRDFFEHLKAMSNGIPTRLSYDTSVNAYDATAAVGILIQTINAKVGFEELQACNHVRCSDHSVQLAVLQVVRLTQKCLEQ